MEFAEPGYLYGLVLLPLAVLFLRWAARRRRAALARWGDLGLMARLSDNVSLRKRRWKVGLWLFSLVAVVVALARPRWGTQLVVTAQTGVEVMVVLDVSASMLAEDIKPNRLTRAKLTVEELMGRLGGHEVGLVIFSGAAFVQFPLTADFYTARSFLERADPTMISRPGTALQEALQVALAGFPPERASRRVILLLTDGEGHEDDPMAAVQDAVDEGVIVYAIGFGLPTGEPIPVRAADGTITGYKKDAQGETVLSKLDEVTLQQIATRSGGLYFRASAGGEEVEAVVEAIDRMATGEGETESQFETHGVERFGWFAGAALLALSVDTVLGERKRGG